MTKANETYFVDKNTFAIRYVPGYSDKNKKYFYAYCHIVLGGQIIGYKEEPCYLNYWKDSFEKLKNQIKNNFDKICHFEFKDKNAEEIFELIWKANQLEEDFQVEYDYLPVLDNNVWSNCSISLDETTDAYLITMTGENGKIKFLWKGYSAPCLSDKMNKLYSTIVERQFVVETMEKCLQTIENEHLNYPKNE